MTIQKVAVSEIAKILAILSTETLAAVLSEWVSVWDNPESCGYTEFQANVVEQLFEAVSEIRPDAVMEATNNY